MTELIFNKIESWEIIRITSKIQLTIARNNYLDLN
jgi:hypothetical protein